jgi:hypothetical protein
MVFPISSCLRHSSMGDHPSALPISLERLEFDDKYSYGDVIDYHDVEKAVGVTDKKSINRAFRSANKVAQKLRVGSPVIARVRTQVGILYYLGAIGIREDDQIYIQVLPEHFTADKAARLPSTAIFAVFSHFQPMQENEASNRLASASKVKWNSIRSVRIERVEIEHVKNDFDEEERLPIKDCVHTSKIEEEAFVDESKSLLLFFKQQHANQEEHRLKCVYQVPSIRKEPEESRRRVGANYIADIRKKSFDELAEVYQNIKKGIHDEFVRNWCLLMIEREYDRRGVWPEREKLQTG